MQISEHIHQVRIDFEIPLPNGQKLPRFVNVIIALGKEIALIDSGVRGSRTKIFDYIRKQSRSEEEITRLFLSHAHPDHIGSAATIKDFTGCHVYAHIDETTWMRDLELQNEERPVPGFFSLVDEPANPDRILSGDEHFKLGPHVSIHTIHAPGHSPGQLMFSFPKDKVLFTADAIPLKGDIPNYHSFPALKKSLQLIRENKDYNILLSSWTEPVKEKKQVEQILMESEHYLDTIDKAVKKYYTGNEKSGLEPCQKTVEALKMPEFYVNPLVDKAFRSHLVKN